MKVLFVVPNLLISSRGFAAAPYVSLPLGVLSIASFLRENGWDGEMEVYDARLSAKTSYNDIGEKLFGDTDWEMADFIGASDPDVVAISNMFTSQFSRALRAAELAKTACPDCMTVLGGPHVSSFPLEVIREPNVDFVVMGEGEERMLSLLQALARCERPQIQGVLGGEEDAELLRPNPRVRIRFINDIDTLPLPAYDMVDVERYFQLQSNGYSPRPREWGSRAVTLITSRGCPHQCIFCSIQTTMGYRWRPHSVAYVKDHIAFLQARYQIDFIHFEDDNFSHDPGRYDEIIEGLLALANPIQWDTPNGIRGDTWTRDRVRKTKESGCQYLTVAIESTSQHVLDKVVKKRLDLAKVNEFIRYCYDENLRMNAFYVIGMPGETMEDIEGTVRTALKYYWKFSVWPILSIAMPLPGTEMYEIVTRENYHKKELGFGYGVVETEHFTPKKLNDAYKKFTRVKILIFLCRSLMSWEELRYHMRLVWNFRSQAAGAIATALSGIVRMDPNARQGAIAAWLRGAGSFLGANKGQGAVGRG
jgi:anaerobic magnesium-protoporphyrin IX monomethyl ester cyclase